MCDGGPNQCHSGGVTCMGGDLAVDKLLSLAFRDKEECSS